MKTYLQNIIQSFQFENLPAEWQQIDLSKFSDKKTLFDYQQKALENALIALYKYYVDCDASKESFFYFYQNNGLTEDLDLKLNENKKTRIFEDFDNDYKIEDDKIAFYHFINRMSFWMATGSGKTLVIVKLIELLALLMKENQISKNDILFLTYREDLIEQFKSHIEEFNESNNFIINLYNLKDYSSIKRGGRLKFGNEIDIFYYRSDLISDEQKDKIIDFKNYDNNGKWYVILDEAHKGDKEESKRQHYYSVLSRNGFLFNFSATFTDETDFATCVYNFNLARFVEEGYGKHIYVSKENITALENNDELSVIEKQKILLKIFILQTAINLQYDEIKNINNKIYHKPLLLTLVNSVNTEDSDLELFFKEIEKIAIGQINDEILKNAKEELINELSSEHAKYEFEELKVNNNILQVIQNINYQSILKSVFNAETTGKIEVIKIPGNQQELVFKVVTSDIPFALMKIGDISQWIKEKLTGYEIVEKFENESLFKNLNYSSDINILMGSRSFYEGWDSNRPNIILFINIGKGSDARKFVLQSIGRGVRIEPLPYKRKRAQFLYNNNEIEKSLYEAIKDKISAVESLFVFGTKADNLNEVIKTLKEEKGDEVLLGDLFEINPDIKDKTLLIPTYKLSDIIIAEEKDIVKFPIHSQDYEQVKNYFNYIGDKIAVVKFDCNIKVLSKVNEGFNGQKDRYFIFDDSTYPVNRSELLLYNILNHFNNRIKEVASFKTLEEEIIHFKRITISAEKLNSIREKIEKVKKSKDKEIVEQMIDEKFEEGLITKEEYKNKIKEMADIVKEEEIPYTSSEKLKIKYIANHYYIPIALSESERADFICHIIKTKSEIDFINELEKYLNQDNNIFKQFDWWFFSKIDETLDEVYIPYYQPKTNRIENFKPDFIFWLKKDNNYTIIFFDPKGTEHTDGYRKIDGYSRIFEIEKNGQKQIRNFSYNGFTINVKLLLKSKQGIAGVPENYKAYWFDSFINLSLK